MKKFAMLIITLLFVFTLASCLDEYDDNDLDDDNDLEGEDVVEVLRVGMDLRYRPFEYSAGGNPTGISADVAHMLGEFLGKDVVIIDTSFGQLIPSLNSGEVDIIIASMSITEDRKQSVDFSDPYFYFKIISLVNQDFADANGITGDTTTEELLAIEGAQYVGIASQVSATIPQDEGKDVIVATDLGNAVAEVSQGTADILLMSAFPVTRGHNANPNTTMVVWDPFVSSPIGMAVAKGNEELLEKANLFIASMNEPGGAYDVLTERWDDTVREDLGRYGLEFFIND